MAYLTRPQKYNIEDSNIALLGSDLEKEVREHAGDKEPAWETAGQEPGTQIWRIEQFTVKEWPKANYGYFFDGDSYIVLHTYKKTPDSESLSYDLHFWLGAETSQDEAGTAAYKTVELDDQLGGAPVQYREIQSYESPRLLSYFPKFICMHGGIASGFHHVSELPPDNTRRLFRISSTQVPGRPTPLLQIREVPAEGSSIEQGGVYVLDMGARIWQFNTQDAVGKVKFKAAEFVQSLVIERQSQCDTTVYDEHGQGAGIFLSEFDLKEVNPAKTSAEASTEKHLFRLSDSTGELVFEPVSPPTEASLSSDDAFILDDSANPAAPAIYVWVGSRASLNERRLALQYGQWYLYKHRQNGGRAALATYIVKMDEGRETEAFNAAIAPSESERF